MYSIKKRSDYVAVLMRQKEQVFLTRKTSLCFGGISIKIIFIPSLKDIVRKVFFTEFIRVCYSTVPLNEIHPWKLGAKALHDYCYISAETILAERRFYKCSGS